MDKVFGINIVIVSCVVGMLMSTFSTDANARYTKRSDKWESTFKLLENQSAEIGGENGSVTKLKSDVGWGFSLGYNINHHILVNYELTTSTPSYHAHLISDQGAEFDLKTKADIFDSQFNVTYNVLASQFTPFVQAGIGWSFVDSNVASGPPVGGCWPTWWAYYCGSYQNTFNDTRFSYNAAAGFRYELANNLLFKLSYRETWIDFRNSSNTSIGSFQFDIGSIF